MKNIRNGVFETNSSSVHTIAISRGAVKSLPKQVDFYEGEYGWEVDTVSDTASYLYTGATPEQMEKIVDMLKEEGVACNLHSREGRWWGGIDHGGEVIPIIDAIVSDKDRLLRFLFGDSVIYTGNDNMDDENAMCFSGDPTISVDDPLPGKPYYSKEIPNPNHHPDKYEYYVKGN